MAEADVVAMPLGVAVAAQANDAMAPRE